MQFYNGLMTYHCVVQLSTWVVYNAISKLFVENIDMFVRGKTVSNVQWHSHEICWECTKFRIFVFVFLLFPVCTGVHWRWEGSRMSIRGGLLDEINHRRRKDPASLGREGDINIKNIYYSVLNINTSHPLQNLFIFLHKSLETIKRYTRVFQKISRVHSVYGVYITVYTIDILETTPLKYLWKRIGKLYWTPLLKNRNPTRARKNGKPAFSIPRTFSDRRRRSLGFSRLVHGCLDMNKLVFVTAFCPWIFKRSGALNTPNFTRCRLTFDNNCTYASIVVGVQNARICMTIIVRDALWCRSTNKRESRRFVWRAGRG